MIRKHKIRNKMLDVKTFTIGEEVDAWRQGSINLGAIDETSKSTWLVPNGSIDNFTFL